MTIDDGYVLRDAVPEDAELIAQQRALMFMDMGLLSEEKSAALIAVTVPWIHGLLSLEQYKGWFVECAGGVVAGGGLHLDEIGPVPSCPRVGRRGHIANVYTLPTHRRRGLARRLLEEMMNWTARNGIDQLTLEASSDGRRLYTSLGFADVAIMRRSLPQSQTEAGGRLA